MPSAVPLARTGRRREAVLQAARGGAAAHRKGVYLIGRVVIFEDPMLSDGRPQLAIKNAGRLALAQPRRPRLDEPVRQARLGLQRLDRRGRRARRLRRDPVRLRPLPVRRRHGRRSSIPGKTPTPPGLGDRRVRAVRGEAAEAARRARLDRRLRARRDPRPRDRAGAAPAREVRRRRSTRWSIRRTTAPASTGSTTRTTRPARPSNVALALPARAEEGKGGADPVAAGLLLRPRPTGSPR